MLFFFFFCQNCPADCKHTKCWSSSSFEAGPGWLIFVGSELTWASLAQSLFLIIRTFSQILFLCPSKPSRAVPLIYRCECVCWRARLAKAKAGGWGGVVDLNGFIPEKSGSKKSVSTSTQLWEITQKVIMYFFFGRTSWGGGLDRGSQGLPSAPERLERVTGSLVQSGHSSFPSCDCLICSYVFRSYCFVVFCV